mmetsp:Transcript_60649/g.169479  ORF Transcript_60649/g.169479 Transcript_60649/m.169479 type:complete len:279 (+) Transcript_60649:36-872(+)
MRVCQRSLGRSAQHHAGDRKRLEIAEHAEDAWALVVVHCGIVPAPAAFLRLRTLDQRRLHEARCATHVAADKHAGEEQGARRATVAVAEAQRVACVRGEISAHSVLRPMPPRIRAVEATPEDVQQAQPRRAMPEKTFRRAAERVAHGPVDNRLRAAGDTEYFVARGLNQQRCQFLPNKVHDRCRRPIFARGRLGGNAANCHSLPLVVGDLDQQMQKAFGKSLRQGLIGHLHQWIRDNGFTTAHDRRARAARHQRALAKRGRRLVSSCLGWHGKPRRAG